MIIPERRVLEISLRYQQVLEHISVAARSVGRDPKDVKLVVVTKGHPQGVVEAAISAGARSLGENYVDEGQEKILSLSGQIGVEWHMIGHVQSRKARQVCEHFNMMHSLDSVKLAQRLDRFCEELNKRLPVLLECNVSGEASKYGFPAWDQANQNALLPEVEEILRLKNLQVLGLMSMAPFFDNSESARPYFVRTRQLRDALAKRFPESRWSDLSMGMSGDFEPAIQEGATLVRIGQAILGPRLKKD